jgi:archaemetzincin
MKENLFADLEQVLAPCRQALPAPRPGDWRRTHVERNQPFEAYRRGRPARQTARRKALYLSRVGALTAAQGRVVAATAEYLAVFFDLPVRAGADFDPAAFPSFAVRQHPYLGRPQLLTNHLVNEVMWLDRPEEALICLAVTAWDLWSADAGGDHWVYVLGEAFGGHAGVWSLRYLGDPGAGEKAYRRCLKRSFATATHEAAHVLGLDHCVDARCNMNGANCLSEADGHPLHLCPLCLRKLCWNRQVDLLPYLRRLSDFFGRGEFPDEAEWYERMIRLLHKPEAPARSASEGASVPSLALRAGVPPSRAPGWSASGG